MTDKELKDFNWTEVQFAKQANKNILILVSSDNSSADYFLKILKSKEFNLGIIQKGQLKTYTFQLDFKEGGLIGFETAYTEDNFPVVKLAKNQQLTHVTTAYRDDQSKLQLLSPYHTLENLIHLN
ncbi:MAG: hypothetical protein QY309_13195 [Cyclobacteriaceae bacterium]|nr:MAG: hypothetical protein QY309_13195 [Cyclobacteriaceae bacterium]